MNDEFHFGEPARHPARLGKGRSPDPRGIDGRIVWIAAGLAVAGVLAFVFLRAAGEAGNQIGNANSQVVDQIDGAYDAAAQGSIGRAQVVAQSLYAERGTYTTDRATLLAFDPSVRFTSGASNGPNSIAFAATDSAFAAAVHSESGTCWWVKIEVSLTSYGSGTPCTGDAAMGAAEPSW